MTAVSRILAPRALAGVALIAASGALPAQGMRDPMQPPGYTTAAAPAGSAIDPAPAEPRLTLQSVLITADRRHAWVNDRAVEVGDRIGRQRVARIEAGSVTLVDATGKRTVLALHPDVIRRTDAVGPTAARAGADR